MTRWGFVGFMVLLVAAVLMRFTPVAYADGCEGGDSTAGHNAIAFCCGDGHGNDRDKGHGKGSTARIISNHTVR